MIENDKIGVIKEFDKLGRIVIPKELRERFFLDDKVEIIATKDGIILKNPEYVLIKETELKKIDTRLCIFLLPCVFFTETIISQIMHPSCGKPR